MNKKIKWISAILTVTFITTISINLSISKQEAKMGILFENIEAFANDGEAGGIKITTCIGNKTPCKLSDGSEGWGKPTQISVDW